MSFILDALRKSESRRRSGQAPQLGDHHGDHPAVGRRRRPAILVIALAIAVPVVVAAVAVIYFEPGFLDRDNSAPATAESSAGDTQSPRPEQLAMAETDEAEAESRIEQSAADDATETRQRRRRVRTPPPEDDAAGSDARSEPRERIVTDPDEATEEIRREVERAERRVAQPDDETADERRSRTPPPAEAEVEGEAEPEVNEEAWRPDAAEYVRAWELPLAVRRELPDLDLSIHVFAPEPDKRFVLINGERRVAGDELGGGARLVEIRREGALVDFRDHRFLLEP